MVIQTRRSARRRLTVIVAAVALIAVLAVAVVMADHYWKNDISAPTTNTVASAITTTDLITVARTRVFFGHQSVGMNMLNAVPGIYAEHNVSAPPIEQGLAEAGADSGFIVHKYIGANTKPFLKIEDFDHTMRAGIGGEVDVAIMKFCSIDITSSADVDAIFARYRDTMAALERDFPNVTFIHVTVPLTTDPDLLSKLKTMVKTVLGRPDQFGRPDNAARERLNELIRHEYRDRNLFDLAAVESTRPDGTRVSGRSGNQEFFALYDGYAADRLHLNAFGSTVAATGLLEAIAQASRK
ncbi:MAG TPA: hypothetical protein VFW21_13170 [Mycobacterium sp.]|nr:hypothetical protein [Mycobacterium sp.]